MSGGGEKLQVGHLFVFVGSEITAGERGSNEKAIFTTSTHPPVGRGLFVSIVRLDLKIFPPFNLLLFFL